MRTFINFFLIAYAVDAGLSTLDDLIAVLSGVQVLGPLRNLVGVAVFLLSMPVYVSLGIDSRLPKRMLLPLTLLAAWAALGFLPLPIFLEGHGLLLGGSLLQLLLSGCAFLWVRRISDHWLLPPAFFDRPAFQLKNTLWFASANIVLAPAAILLLLASSAYLYLEHKTAGFMQIGADGLYLQERTYIRDDKTVHLMAMIHIGSPEYYAEISESLRTDDIVVLAEGVSDSTGLIDGGFPSYSKVADLIGLDTQENMRLHGTLVEYDQLDDVAGETREPVIVRADIDVKDLSEDALAFIRNVGELFNNNQSLAEGMNAYLDWYSTNMTPEKEKRLMGEIIGKRNAVVIDHLDEALLYYDRIVIPWGALHMPGLEQAVLEKDFTPAERTSRLAVDYDRLIQQPDATEAE